MKKRLAAACVAALLLMPSTAAWSEPQNQPDAAFAATAARLLQQERAVLGAAFAGAWLDGTQVYVGFAGGDALAAARRHPRLAALARGARFVERRYSTAALDRAMAGVVARMRRDGGAYTAAVNVPDNVVDVTVAKPVDGLASGAVRVTVGRVEAASPFACDTRTACAVLRAGLVIAGGGAECTMGFTVRNATGREFATSAGHCSGVSTTWSHNGTQIGSTAWSQASGSADGQVISLRRSTLPKATNVVYRDADHATRVVAKIGAPDATLLGQQVCSESRSGSKCGGVTSYNASVQFRRPDGTSYTMTNMGQYAGAACQGDSGGPIVGLDTAYGFVTGGVAGADGCAVSGTTFTWGRNFETASGYTIVTDDGASRELRAGQTLVSPNGSYRAEMQGDGNFVVYSPTSAIWASNTNGYPGSWLVFQEDGNMVVYRPGGVPIWASNTVGRSVERATIDDTGLLALYNVGGVRVWGSGRDVLYAGQNMYANAELRSPNGVYKATMQTDGNLVVYYIPTGLAIWASNTAWATGAWAQMQLDGNFVLYRPGPVPICATGTSGTEHRMVMRNDGVLALTTPAGTVPWDTATRTC